MKLKKILSLMAVMALIAGPALAGNEGMHLGGMEKDAKKAKMEAKHMGKDAEKEAKKAEKEMMKAKKQAEKEAKRAEKEAMKAKKKAEAEARKAAKEMKL